MKKSAITLLLLITVLSIRGAAIGQWNFYMAYNTISDIEPAGKYIYVLNTGSLFSYNTNDQSIQEYNKGNGLNDTDISIITWNESAKRLVIVYTNNNIDLLDNDGNVINMSEYKNKNMTEDKTIHNVCSEGYYTYLLTNFGFIKLNVKDAEFSNTYNLGTKIEGVATVGDYIYVSSPTDKKIYKGNVKANLLDKDNWEDFGKSFISPVLRNFNDNLIGISSGNIIKYSLNSIYNTVILDNADNRTTFINDNGNKMVLCCKDITYVYDGNEVTQLSTPDVTVIGYDKTNDCYWTNDTLNHLQKITYDENGSIVIHDHSISPEGPLYNRFESLLFNNNILYSTGGYYTSRSQMNYPGIVQILKDNQWSICEEDVRSHTGHAFSDMMFTAVDPKKEGHIYVGGRTGLYEFQDGMFVEEYNFHNSPLQTAITNNRNYVLVLGGTYDKAGNLWVMNSMVNGASLVERSADGTWVTHDKEEFIQEGSISRYNMRHLFEDSRGYIWFVNDHWVGTGFGYYDPATDTAKYYDDFINQDNTEISAQYVFSIAEDYDHNIWVGTESGPILLKVKEIQNGGTSLTQVKVPRNDGTNYADYLLASESISAIAIDKANRKWFGTMSDGVYLIDSDNITELYHFTAENSELLDNYIHDIAINHNTGEVFFATEKGLCSYMGDATETNDELVSDNIYAYPNPVRPDYTGLITIVGLTYNADIKITTANGTLVNSGRSHGGTYTWNGCDQNGERVASGVYMVQTAKSDGSKGTVCKIAIVR